MARTLNLLFFVIFLIPYTFAQEEDWEHYEIVGAKLGRKISRQINQADYDRTVMTDKVAVSAGYWAPGNKTGYSQPLSFVGAMDGAVMGSLAKHYEYQNYYHGPRQFNYRKKKDISTDISSLEVCNITYADEDGDGTLGKEEVAQVYFDLINTGDNPIYGIIPVLLADKTKHLIISAPCPIDTINPKSALRYVIELTGDGKRNAGNIYLVLKIKYGQQQSWDVKEIVLGTKRKRE